jgi:Amt family ammonium transporter
VPAELNSGDTAWVLASAALVLFMTPGLALFYGGMARAKNMMSILMQNYVTMGLVSVLWVVIGYSLAFGDGGGWIGDAHFVGLGNINDIVPGFVNAETGAATQTIPPLVFVAFQMMFAIITPALFTGSIAERMKLAPFIFLIAAWSLLVYSPVAHWVFSPMGWLFERGAWDFAGGTVVHVNAGAAGLALALVLGKRKGWPQVEMPAHNLPLLVTGAGILWLGWFGFNAGSALGANAIAGYAFINTNTAAAIALLAWIVVERLRGTKPTSLGAASGLIAGLVAITPAAGFVNPVGSIIIGLTAGIVCNFACSLKYKAKFDDALDVVGIHLFGGIVGSIAVGLLATTSVNSAGPAGLFYDGGSDLLVDQIVAVLAVGFYSFIATFIIAKVLDVVFGGLRVPEADEEQGLDIALHGEMAYDWGYGEGSLGGGPTNLVGRVESHRSQRTGIEQQG